MARVEVRSSSVKIHYVNLHKMVFAKTKINANFNIHLQSTITYEIGYFKRNHSPK